MCRELLIVEEGTVKIVKSALSGRQQLLGIERKGSSLAEVAVFDGGRYPASAEATSSTTLLRLSADSFRQTCLKNPKMALKVFKVLAHRLRHLVSLVEELSFATVRARLIQLAVRLGTVRELISRNLGRLHGDKLIEMNKRTVNIPDLAILRDEIGGSI